MENAAGLVPLLGRFAAERTGANLVSAQLARDLDAFYWAEVDRTVASAARENPEQLVFDRRARLLLDLGHLDWKFLEGGEKNRAQLLREIYQPAAKVLHLSEWLSRRYRQFVLYGR